MSLTVAPEDDGLPVRRLALERLHMSYGQFKRAKFEGELLLEGRRVHADERALAGQRLLVRMPQRLGGPCEPGDLLLNIPYEDEDLLIVDKPAPLPSVPSRKRDALTLENAVYSYFGCPEGFLFRPVNRLDKGTTGLMAVAKSGYIHDRLRRTLHTDGFSREYRAVCVGCPEPPAGTIDAPIGWDETSAVRRMVRSDGQRAVSHYEVLSQRNGLSFVKLQPETGRTHQLRVHMAHIGCPLAGDWLYGTEDPDLISRPALHAYALALTHPVTGTHLYFTAPIPADMEKLI